MKHIVIVGGGVAGLTAGTLLSKKGHKVTILESSPKLGGRAYSFTHHFKSQESNLISKDIDNGQHLLMGCYPYFLSFLQTLGTYNKLNVPKNFDITFYSKDKFISYLKTTNSLYPFNLAVSILRFTSLSLSERIRVIHFILKIPFTSNRALKNLSVYDWLLKNNQSANVINNLWSVIAVGALNCDLKSASAVIFKDILREMFLKGNFNTKLIVPEVGLSELYATPAFETIQNNHGEVSLSESVQSIETNNNRVVSIVTNKRVIKDFDVLVFAIPSYALSKIGNIEKCVDTEKISNLKWAPILSIHLLIKKKIIQSRFAGLLNQLPQWVFLRENILSVVISNSSELINESHESIFEKVFTDLHLSLGLERSDVIDFKILHDKRSTFIPNIESEKCRPEIKTKVSNLYLIGDWVNTGLPATLESAAKSGTILTQYL